MCLAIPGEIVEVITSLSLPMAKVNFCGIVKSICIAYVPEASLGDYVLVHAGFAISKINKEEAEKTLSFFEKEELIQELDAEEQNEIS